MPITLKKSQGFTIIELLIVIVIIAILAAITLVAYSSIQQRALNSARFNELTEWQKLFEMYKVVNGNYPDMPAAQYCLGYNFPKGDSGVPSCRDLYYAPTEIPQSTNEPLMTMIRTVGTIPNGPRAIVNGSVGPFATYTTNSIQLTMIINGSPTDCPQPTTGGYTDNNGRSFCFISLTR